MELFIPKNAFENVVWEMSSILFWPQSNGGTLFGITHPFYIMEL